MPKLSITRKWMRLFQISMITGALFWPFIESRANDRVDIKSLCNLLLSPLPNRNFSIPFAINDLTLKVNFYNVKRSLSDYRYTLGDAFVDASENLDSDGSWIDVGAGEARAQLQFFSRRPYSEISLTAVGVSIPFSHRLLLERENKKHPNATSKFRYLSGRKIQDIPDSEIGKADIVTDVYGSSAYDPHVDQAMRRLLCLLKPQGKLFIAALADSMRIVDEFNRAVPIQDWINSIQGIRVLYSEESRDGKAHARDVKEGLGLQVTGEPVVVPELELIQFTADTPPMRTYLWRRSATK